MELKNFMELAKKRCSVRGYIDKEVEEEKIKYILECALLAPSACNNQPIFFIVIREKDTIKRLEEVYNRTWFLEAPVIIAVCCDRRSSWHRSDGKDYGDIDVAIAFDHLTLAATEVGLGTCWVGAFNPTAAKRILMLPDHVDPIAFTPVGYPAPFKSIKKRKKLEEIVFYEYFGGKKRN